MTPVVRGVPRHERRSGGYGEQNGIGKGGESTCDEGRTRGSRWEEDLNGEGTGRHGEERRRMCMYERGVVYLVA